MSQEPPWGGRLKKCLLKSIEQEEQREINEQARAALNCAEEYVIDSGGQDTCVIMEKVYGRNLWTDLEERKTGREKHA